MTAPFLSEATAANIKQLARRGFATALLVGEMVDLTLWRDSEEDGSAVQVAAQTVLVDWADRQAQRPAGSEAPLALNYDGTFRKFAPFDCLPGDRFSLPSGSSGMVTLVQEPVNGIVTARFRLEVG